MTAHTPPHKQICPTTINTPLQQIKLPTVEVECMDSSKHIAQVLQVSRYKLYAMSRSNIETDIEFKPSPFYKIQRQIDMKVCDSKAPLVRVRTNLTNSKGMDSHRHQVQLNIKTAEHPELLNLDSNTRVMVFCATGSGLGRQDIAFPHPSELKVNSVDSKQNLRGTKNKPGTTRPVDITKMLRLNLPKYQNTVEFIYALTKEAGSFQVRMHIPSLPHHHLSFCYSQHSLPRLRVLIRLTEILPSHQLGQNDPCGRASEESGYWNQDNQRLCDQ